MGEGQRPIFRRNAVSILRRHGLQRGLRGYLILFDHRTLVLDWQVESRSVLSPLVVLRGVKAFHRSPSSTLSTETTSVITLTLHRPPHPSKGVESKAPWFRRSQRDSTRSHYRQTEGRP